MREHNRFSAETYPLTEQIEKVGAIELVDEDKKEGLKIAFC